MKHRIAAIFLVLVLFVTAFPPMSASAEEYENTYVNTGDQRADIIGVALTQVGYIEQAGGVTKYGIWYNYPTADWCGIFISWCAEQAGVPRSVLKKTGWANPYEFGFSSYYTSSQYTPRPGDLFFTPNNRGGFSHAGIVYYVEGSYFYTLEGNTWYGGKPHGVYSRQRKLSDYVYVSPNYNGGTGDDPVTTPIPPVNTPAPPPSCSHNWKDDSVTKEPGCTTSGSKKQVCTKCSQTRTVSISAKGHAFGDWVEKDETEHQRTCDNCDKVETKKHDVKDVWVSDSAGHWKECETCAAQLEVTSHTYEGGCGSKCTECEYQSQDGHNYGPWLKDETGHWQVCTACDLEGERYAHNYLTECSEVCQDCGYTRETEHTFEQRVNEVSHWEVCTVCGKESARQRHIPGPEATEENAQICTHCNYVLSQKLLHVHTLTYTAHQHSHQGQCECGYVEEVQGHAWSMEKCACSLCGAPAVVAEQTRDWDKVWLAGVAVVVTGMLLWIGLALITKKKKV